MEIYSLGWWEVVLAGVATLAIFSFLIKENPAYRIFEHLFIGVATAIGIASVFRYFIIPEVVDPLFGLDLTVFPDGTTAEPYKRGNLFLLVPIVFGSLYYFILSRRFSWIAQLVIGFSLGVGGGNAFKGFLNEMLPQLKDSFRSLYVPDNLTASLSNAVFLFTLLCSMSYFFFTFRRSETSLITKSARAGRYLMMSCFGAFFGATIMARMALLVERLEFLLNKFFPSVYHIWS